MKRFLGVLMTAALMTATLAGCGEQSPESPEVPSQQVTEPTKEPLEPSYTLVNNGVLDVTATDVFGDHSITILGDSISHGAATVDIHKNSWSSILKEAVTEKSGDHNYGFVSVEGTLWGQTLSTNLHAFPTTEQGFKNPGAAGDGWTEYRTAGLLGTKGLGSSVNGATLTFAPTERFKFFCVYYEAGAEYGTFDVLDSTGKVLLSVDASTGDGYARTEMIDMRALPEDLNIVLKATSDKEIIFTGIGYYNVPGGVVVANYANSGLQLAGTGVSADGNVTGLDEKFLDMATDSGTLIFALGYNDAYFTSDMDLFAQKIDYLIEKANEKGTKVIVSDCVWDTSNGDKLFKARYPRVFKVKEQLKRLAEETNGIYIDQQIASDGAILDTLDDGVHPNADGHRMMADAILEALGL